MKGRRTRWGLTPVPTAATAAGETMFVSGIKFFFRMASLLVNAVVALALVGVILFFFLPRILHWDLQVVRSGSMEPALPVGSVVLIRPLEAESISVGDIITYRQQGSPDFVTHRVAEVLEGEDGPSFRTKGDANEEADTPPVPADSVAGRVWVDIPYLGHAAQYARQPWGILLLVGVPGLIIIVGEVRNIIGELRKGKRLAVKPKGDGA